MKLLTAVFLLASANASAYVGASPSYFDFGSVQPGRSVSTRIQFTNYSNQAIQFFRANCSGDYSAYTCTSDCYSLSPYGSCSVTVWFTPRSGDGLRKTIWVNGMGGGHYSSATVNGTDAKAP